MKKVFLTIFLIVLIVLLIICGVGLGFFLTDNEEALYPVINTVCEYAPSYFYRYTYVTEENLENINKNIADKLGEENATYYSYACLGYIFEDGLSNLFTLADNESLMYERISGKTINQLIEEGKALMEQNNITWQEFLNNMENADDFLME